LPLLQSVALLAGGLVLLAVGGEALVRGATRLARLAGLTPAVIGLTVVAMGTSLPELVVSVMAALRGTPDIALGNVVGSNIFNVTIIIGIAAVVVPLPVNGSAIRIEWPFMFAVSIAVLVLASDGGVGRFEGAGLLAMLLGFTVYMVRRARREVSGREAAEFADETERRSVRSGRRAAALSLLSITAGIILLVAGGRLLVDGATALAQLAGLTERVIGLTVVAAGTSAPELATSVVAALRRHTDVAVANIIGSNIFNLLGILGTSALLSPIPVSPAILRVDMPWMLGTSLLLFPIFLRFRRITRWEGALLVAVYLVYLTLLLRST
jgi:cation:H+ antiporter